MEDKQYVVIGLGIFGSTVAKTLSRYGCEVLAIDKDVTCVERVAEFVTKAVVGDSTNIEEMSALGLEDMDVAVVAIGDHLEEAVLTTMLLKELEIPYIVAKARNKQFKKILEKVGADKVIRPEKDMGIRIAKGLLRKNIVDLVELDDNYSIVEIAAPKEWLFKTLKDLNVRVTYHMNILGVKPNDSDELILNVGPDYLVQRADRFLVIAKTSEIEDLDII